eukprot:6175768-Pleurochrysis_carterae.AAC.1
MRIATKLGLRQEHKLTVSSSSSERLSSLVHADRDSSATVASDGATERGAAVRARLTALSALETCEKA